MNDIALLSLRDMLDRLISDTPQLPPPTDQLPDKWIAASAMQKGVRRGKVNLVLQALDTLWNIDPRYARRRLATIAFEDVGLGNPDVVAITVMACSGTKYLPKEKIYPAVRACAIALATAAKERSAEHIYTLLAYHDAYDLIRDRFAHKTHHQLADIVIDTDRFLIERAAAAWFLAGTKRFGAGLMPEVQGDLEAYEWAIEQLDTPLWQPLVTMAGIRVTQCALPIFWPLKLSQKECGEASIIDNRSKLSEDKSLVPSYLLDHFTRGGKTVIRNILKEDNNITRWLTDKLPRKAWQPTTEVALFYLVSDRLDQQYTFAGSNKLHRLSIEADCCRWGLQAPDVTTFLKIVSDSLEEIEGRRKAFIRKSGW